jgi:outer membrane protein OmpA-like peptidoglycan-associated protein
MDGRAHLRTERGWLKFDQTVLTLAALTTLLLVLLNHWGYGPRAYKSCANRGAITTPAQIRTELPKMAPAPLPAPVPLPQAKVDGPKPLPVTPVPPVKPAREPVKQFVPPTPAPMSPTIQAVKTGQQVALMGIVPSAQSKSDLVSDAQRVLGSDGVVIDRLVVDTTIKPAPWLGDGADIVKLLRSMREQSAVFVSGTDVRLTGTVTGTTDREVAGLKAVEIFGPESKLHNLVDVKPLKPPLVEIEARGKHAVLTGYVNSEATYNAVMQNVVSVYGAENITDRLAVDENTSPITWQPAVLSVAAALSGLKLPGAVRITSDSVILTGVADTDTEKSSRGVTISRLLGPMIKIDNKITVRELATPVVDFQNTGGKLTLSGQVEDETVKTALVDAAKTAFGAANITDRLTVGEMTGPIGWATKIGQVTEQVLSLTLPGGIRASGNTITLTGTVSSAPDRETQEAAAKNLFGADAKIDNQIKIVAPAPPPEPEPLPVPTTPPKPEPEVAQAPPPVPVVDCTQIASGAVVEFALNKADLTERGKGVLDQVLACLKDNRYEVAGHTDSTGKAAWNKELSLMRASAAVSYLVSKGVDKRRLDARGFGSDQPVVSNATADGRAKNRRISFTARP